MNEAGLANALFAQLGLNHSSSATETSSDSREPSIHFERNLDPEDHKQDEPGHRPAQAVTSLSCVVCNESCSWKSELDAHCLIEKHKGVACSCGKGFSRHDALLRHCDSLGKKAGKFPCSLCKRHRGKQSFRRQDHLTQHLREYHGLTSEKIKNIRPKFHPHLFRLVCHHPGCEFHRGQEYSNLSYQEQVRQRPFNSRSDYTKHLKRVHNETPFPCCVAGCEHIGARGYMTEDGLRKHLATHSGGVQHLTELSGELEENDWTCLHCGWKPKHWDHRMSWHISENLSECSLHMQALHQDEFSTRWTLVL
ncbi:hypothetical protein GGR54DRAFT_607838 [Hypoxylon sp. NC1633]|nr:hypothetical protein GGR54DRAFT_607838 [Hypoxylon sp. NC1633]